MSNVLARLLSKIKIDERGCWNWTGAKLKRGYGAVKIEGKMKKAHRVSYELCHGSFPEKMHVCHHCDNPSCINPSHLFLGTHAENMADRNAKGRHERKLTQSDVLAIRAADGISQRDLARQYGVHQSHISNIRTCRRGSSTTLHFQYDI